MSDPNVPATQAEPEPKPAVVQQEQSNTDNADATDDAHDGDEGKPEDGKPELTAEQKTIRKLERRIDKLTAQKGELTRAAERELAALRQQLEAKNGSADDDDETPKLTRDDVERLAAEKARELRKQETVSEKVAGVLKLGKKIEGFDAAVNALSEEVPFIDRGRPTAFIQAVLDSDMPADVIHYLGENTDEAAEYAGLSEAQIGRRLARLEDKLKRSAIAKRSSAPIPLKPVNGTSSVKVDEQKLSDAEWWERRKKAKLAKP
jgi:hypothetical protein